MVAGSCRGCLREGEQQRQESQRLQRDECLREEERWVEEDKERMSEDVFEDEVHSRCSTAALTETDPISNLFFPIGPSTQPSHHPTPLNLAILHHNLNVLERVLPNDAGLIGRWLRL